MRTETQAGIEIQIPESHEEAIALARRIGPAYFQASALLQEKLNELKDVYRNLSDTQNRCTVLINESRGLRRFYKETVGALPEEIRTKYAIGAMPPPPDSVIFVP